MLDTRIPESAVLHPLNLIKQIVRGMREGVNRIDGCVCKLMELKKIQHTKS